MLNHWLSLFPKWMIVGALLLLGIGFMLFVQPPHTVCDTQRQIVSEALAGELYPDKKGKYSQTPEFQKSIEYCQATNTPGGCSRLLLLAKSVITDLQTIQKQCRSELGGERPIRLFVWKTLELLVRVAWGAAPPQTYLERYGWLDTSDMDLFCRLKQLAQDFYGAASWKSFREKMMSELPGVDKLSRQVVWQRTILSTRCEDLRAF